MQNQSYTRSDISGVRNKSTYLETDCLLVELESEGTFSTYVVEELRDVIAKYQCSRKRVPHLKQDSIANAKKTARCAQYMGALKSFEILTTHPATAPEIFNGLLF